MGISVKTHKMLWGRAANRCAFCHRELVLDATETDDESIIGEVCHIVANSSSGPRGDSSLPPERRDEYDNLILLCRVDHKRVDDQLNTYTVKRLKEMKATHEEWVRETLEEYDPARQRDDEIYAAYVEEWARYIGIDNWCAWSSWVLGSGQPSLWVSQDRRLKELRAWLLSRFWPGRYRELEASFTNFRNVLGDFLEVFHKYAVDDLWPNCEKWITEKFYKDIPGWAPPLYDQRLRQYNFHVALVQDLMLELTRAANYVCDKVRKFIFPTYRIAEGVLLVQYGPTSEMRWMDCRVEYRDEERNLHPYPGLKQFLIDRTSRDRCFGEGECPDARGAYLLDG
jgi:hypothetical protein